MKLITISNLNIPALQIYGHMRDNVVTKDNSFIADSVLVVNILLNTEIEVRSLLATQKYYDENRNLIESKNIPSLYVADKEVMESIVGHKVHHGVMMHGIRPAENKLEELGDKIVLLDGITKNDNIGVIARSAAALKVDSYVVPKQGPHPYGRKALRVSMGHVSKLRLHCYDDKVAAINSLKQLGYKIFGAETMEDATPLQQLSVPEKWVLVLGNERDGVSKEVLDVCDEVVQIEMSSDVNSFNVGIAASILMYQFQAGTKHNI